MPAQRASSSKAKAADPGAPLGDNAPSIEDLQGQACPNCTTGVLYVKRYDPEALHEQGQSLGEEHQKRSGGAYEVECAYCNFTESRPLNPEA